MLMARRIVIVSSTLAVLSSCILAIKHMVYPLDWQHIFIPILPEKLIDYLCAPMPFLIGILSSSMRLMADLPMEEVVILNVDTGSFHQKPVWESQIPESYSTALKKSLKFINQHKDQYEGRQLSLSVAHTFLRFWVKLWSGYTLFLKKNDRFKFDEFVLTKTPEEQKLLQAIGRSRLCHVFYKEQETLISSEEGLSNYILVTANFDELGNMIKSIPQQLHPSHSQL
uniref:UDENN domain-containing protein n=1 Tax=Arcella intermedia TaxID=1963864 RepID=A0A6B2LGU7_9EUKA